ncbi:hypothetical protein BESB_060280 [Besnoitia besnoiti]|uniref:Uncharacterized protein n=1 Tax=Besnoitia besnoiti TaxID=94643 RepID=A0A2A9MFV8_BESBE|nr:hypothetical protein BESB_060280 [Besnoitia besnoiti]PFH35141.1 hypothetical protein BESB_060280 [Besnoitia besnoiti]
MRVSKSAARQLTKVPSCLGFRLPRVLRLLVLLALLRGVVAVARRPRCDSAVSCLLPLASSQLPVRVSGLAAASASLARRLSPCKQALGAAPACEGPSLSSSPLPAGRRVAACAAPAPRLRASSGYLPQLLRQSAGPGAASARRSSPAFSFSRSRSSRPSPSVLCASRAAGALPSWGDRLPSASALKAAPCWLSPELRSYPSVSALVRYPSSAAQGASRRAARCVAAQTSSSFPSAEVLPSLTHALKLLKAALTKASAPPAGLPLDTPRGPSLTHALKLLKAALTKASAPPAGLPLDTPRGSASLATSPSSSASRGSLFRGASSSPLAPLTPFSASSLPPLSLDRSCGEEEKAATLHGAQSSSFPSTQPESPAALAPSDSALLDAAPRASSFYSSLSSWMPSPARPASNARKDKDFFCVPYTGIDLIALYGRFLLPALLPLYAQLYLHRAANSRQAKRPSPHARAAGKYQQPNAQSSFLLTAASPAPSVSGSSSRLPPPSASPCSYLYSAPAPASPAVAGPFRSLSGVLGAFSGFRGLARRAAESLVSSLSAVLSRWALPGRAPRLCLETPAVAAVPECSAEDDKAALLASTVPSPRPSPLFFFPPYTSPDSRALLASCAPPSARLSLVALAEAKDALKRFSARLFPAGAGARLQFPCFARQLLRLPFQWPPFAVFLPSANLYCYRRGVYGHLGTTPRVLRRLSADVEAERPHPAATFSLFYFLCNPGLEGSSPASACLRRSDEARGVSLRDSLRPDDFRCSLLGLCSDAVAADLRAGAEEGSVATEARDDAGSPRGEGEDRRVERAALTLWKLFERKIDGTTRLLWEYNVSFPPS